jgi:hypothetical protein
MPVWFASEAGQSESEFRGDNLRFCFLTPGHDRRGRNFVSIAWGGGGSGFISMSGLPGWLKGVMLFFFERTPGAATRINHEEKSR